MPAITMRRVARGRLKELYEDDQLSMKKLAKMYEVHYSTMRGWLRAAGAKIRSRAEGRKLVGFIPAPKHLGEGNSHAKLRENEVREIRSSNEESTASLATRFNISPSNVRCIKRRSTWRHIQ